MGPVAVRGPCMTVPGERPCMTVPGEGQTRRFVPFLAASLALTLTLGATLGAISLARLTGTWGHLPRPWVWAHGYVQVFGFLALFVMGFAYHAVPRFVGSALRHAPLVPFSLWLQVGGVLSIASGFLFPLAPAGTRALWILGGAALLGAAALFAVVVAATVRARWSEPQAFEPWMVAGGLWLVVTSGLAVLAAVQDDTTWHHVLWPAALYGFAGSWIFGAGRRLFPASLGFVPRAARLQWPTFALFHLGVVAWCAGAWPGDGRTRLARALGAVALLAAVPAFAFVVGLFGRRRISGQGLDREYRDYQRYVHAGWGWLFIGLLTGPAWSLAALARGAHDSITMLDFSRHTLALGFATQVIMGVGSRFVPVFGGTRLWSPRGHRLAFWLLNLAVAIRALEAVLAAGYWPEAWPFLALSGPPAVAALALFGANLLVALRPPRRPVYTRSSPAHAPLSTLLEIPGALDVLVEAGLRPLRSPLVRASLARVLTLRQACLAGGVALDPLVARLSALKRSPPPPPEAGPHPADRGPGWVPVALLRSLPPGTPGEIRRPAGLSRPDRSRDEAASRASPTPPIERQ